MVGGGGGGTADNICPPRHILTRAPREKALERKSLAYYMCVGNTTNERVVDEYLTVQ